MGLVPTKLQIFLQSRKFLRFVVTRPAREGAVFTAPFEPPDAPHSQPASADDSAKHPIRNGATRTPLAGCLLGQQLVQVAPRLAHVGDAHVAQLGAALVHRLADVLEALVAALLHLLNRLVDVGNLLLSAHDLFLLNR